jgi:plastocyanin
MNSRLTLTLGGLLLVAVTLAGCGGSGYSSPTSPSPSPTPGPTPGGAATVTITIVGMNGAQSFSPNPSAAIVGDTVAFYNADSIVHSIVANGGAFSTGNIAPGATSAPITTTATGNFGYHCSIHPDMVGTLNVTNSSGGY